MIDNNEIGELKTIHSFFSYYNDDRQNIRNQLAMGGGALMDIGCYCISFHRFIFNEEPIDVLGLVKKDDSFGTDILSSGRLEFPSGKTASVTCSTQLYPYQRATLYGTQGYIEIDIPVNAPTLEKTKIMVGKNGQVENIWIDPVDQYTEQVNAFSEAIMNSTAVPTSLEDAVNNMKVIDELLA